MAKKKRGRPKFTEQLKKAIRKLAKDGQLLEPKSFHLYSPVYKGGKFIWVRLLGSDGILARERYTVASDEGGREPIVVAVVVQSEQATSATKPNPLGKAAAALAPLGLWADFKKRNGNKVQVERRRLDVIRVLLLLPKPAALDRQSAFETARQNVQNVVDTVVHAESQEAPQGAKPDAIESAIMSNARRWLFGKGRPQKKTGKGT